MSADGEPGRPLPTVSVVVPTYRRAGTLAAVVQALLGDPGAHEVVVVVDGSTDGSFELLQRLAAEDPRVRPVRQENAGGAAARQRGIGTATGDVVLLVDDDVVAAPGLCTGHARHHAAADDLVVLGYMPTRVPVDLSADHVATRLYAAEYEGMCLAYARDPANVLRRLWGGNVSVRRGRLARVPYDAGVVGRANHSDLDWGVRLQAAGLRGVFDPSLVAVHEHSRTLAQLLHDARAQGEGRHRVHRAHAQELPPFDLGATVADLPAPLRALLSTDGVLGARPALVGLCRLALRAAAVGGAPSVELRAVKVLRRLALREGVRRAARSGP